MILLRQMVIETYHVWMISEWYLIPFLGLLFAYKQRNVVFFFHQTNLIGDITENSSYLDGSSFIKIIGFNALING